MGIGDNGRVTPTSATAEAVQALLRNAPQSEAQLEQLARDAQTLPIVELVYLVETRPDTEAAILFRVLHKDTALAVFESLPAPHQAELISGLRTLGFSVPEDVSVVGWDDIEYAAVSSPALSTVRVPRHRIGALGIDALVAPAGAVTEQRLETRFVPRDSTARRRGAGGGLLAVSDRAEEQAAPTQEQAAPTEAVAGPQAPDHGRAARVW